MIKRFLLFSSLFILFIGLSTSVFAQSLQRAVPEEVGMSSERLERIKRI